MLLAIDAGNSTVKFGVFEGETSIAVWRVSQEASRTAGGYQTWLAPLFAEDGVAVADIHGVVVGSVVPAATGSLIRLSQDYFGVNPMIANESSALIAVDYNPPGTLGIDRLADAVAAHAMFGSPCIAVDFGTATTVNVVTGDPPTFAGGAIAPGLAVMSAALSAKTANLPHIVPDKPATPLARSTAEALRSGLYYGYAALVDGLVVRLRSAAGLSACPVVATGGGATPSLIGDCRAITFREPLLTLHGLRLIYERTRQEVT